MAAGEPIVSLDDPQALTERLLVPRVIWAALLLSVVVYVVMGFMITGEKAPAEVPPVLLYALAGVAITLSAAAPLVYRSLLPPRSDNAGGVGRADLRYVVGLAAFSALNYALYFPRREVLRSILRAAGEQRA
jgi:hypothetical protein